jgi:hypothetical protein
MQKTLWLRISRLLIRQLNTVWVPHPFSRLLRKWVEDDATFSCRISKLKFWPDNKPAFCRSAAAVRWAQVLDLSFRADLKHGPPCRAIPGSLAEVKGKQFRAETGEQ